MNQLHQRPSHFSPVTHSHTLPSERALFLLHPNWMFKHDKKKKSLLKLNIDYFVNTKPPKIICLSETATSFETQKRFLFLKGV